MRTIALLPLSFIAFITVGCSQASMTPLKGPDGHEWVAISCTHSAQNCWKAAGEFCPSGWVAADEVQSTHRGFLFSQHMRDEMLIRCTPPEEHAKRETPATAQ